MRWDHSPFSPQLKPRPEAATPPMSRKSNWTASDVPAPTTMSEGYEWSFSSWPTGGGTKKGKKHYEQWPSPEIGRYSEQGGSPNVWRVCDLLDANYAMSTLCPDSNNSFFSWLE